MYALGLWWNLILIFYFFGIKRRLCLLLRRKEYNPTTTAGQSHSQSSQESSLLWTLIQHPIVFFAHVPCTLRERDWQLNGKSNQISLRMMHDSTFTWIQSLNPALIRKTICKQPCILLHGNPNLPICSSSHFGNSLLPECYCWHLRQFCDILLLHIQYILGWFHNFLWWYSFYRKTNFIIL